MQSFKFMRQNLNIPSTLLLSHRMEAGKNTFTVIPASGKRLQKGNPVVSDETVMYGYESSATLTTDRLHYKLQTRPIVGEGRNFHRNPCES
jgi:hypothetical protein